MRPIFGLVDKRIYSGYDRFRCSVKKRLSSKNERSAQRLGSNAATVDFELPLPGSTIMKTMDMHFSRIDPDNITTTTCSDHELVRTREDV